MTKRTTWRLPAPRELVDVLRIGTLLALLTFALRLLPFRQVARLLASGKAPEPQRMDALAAADLRLLQLVEAIGRRQRPTPTCLAKAAAAFLLLRRRGRAVRLVVGARKTASGFDSHAWLEHDGIVVLGGVVASYAPVWAADTYGTVSLAGAGATR